MSEEISEQTLAESTVTTSVVRSFEEREQFEEQSQAMALANALMEQYAPGFCLIASPHIILTSDGYPVPEDIGLAINPNVNFTPSVIAKVLQHISTQLVEEFDNDFNELLKETESNE